MLAFSLNGCGVPPYDAREVRESFKGQLPTPHNMEYEGRNFHYVTFGNPQNPTLVFIHGSPGGGWELWGDYIKDKELGANFYMVIVDRWGFGRSDFGYAELSLEKQAAPIAAVIKKEAKDGKAVVVGHSYGGPVEFRLAIDYPETVRSLIALAPSVNPEKDGPRWFNYVAQYQVIQWMLPKLLVISNREIMGLSDALKKLDGELPKLTAATTILHGTKDDLVDISSAYYIKENAVNALVELVILEGQNHFLPWNEFDLVKATILKHH